MDRFMKEFIDFMYFDSADSFEESKKMKDYPEFVRFDTYFRSLIDKKSKLIKIEDCEIDRYIKEKEIVFPPAKHMCLFGYTNFIDEDESIFEIFLSSVHMANNPIIVLVIYNLMYRNSRLGNCSIVFNLKDPITSTFLFFNMRNHDDGTHRNTYTEYLCSDWIQAEILMPYLQEDYDLKKLINESKEFGIKFLQINTFEEESFEKSLSKLRYNIIMDSPFSGIKLKRDDFYNGIYGLKSKMYIDDIEKLDFDFDDEFYMILLKRECFCEMLFDYLKKTNKLSDFEYRNEIFKWRKRCDEIYKTSFQKDNYRKESDISDELEKWEDDVENNLFAKKEKEEDDRIRRKIKEYNRKRIGSSKLIYKKEVKRRPIKKSKVWEEINYRLTFARKISQDENEKQESITFDESIKDFENGKYDERTFTKYLNYIFSP